MKPATEPVRRREFRIIMKLLIECIENMGPRYNPFVMEARQFMRGMEEKFVRMDAEVDRKQ